ncbi:MAG: AMP-binding protein, partial [Actinomycetota bacterium]
MAAVPVEGETLVQVFLNRTSATPQWPALRSKDGGSWTTIDYASFRRRAFAVANGLISVGVSPGARVGILSANRPEWLICDFAVMLTGAVTVPVYPTNSPDQVAHVAGHSGCEVLFVEDEAQYEKVLKSRERLPGLRQIVSLSGP